MTNKTTGQIINDILSESETGMSQNDLVLAVLTRQKKDITLNNIEKTQPTVSKALKTLLSHKAILKIDKKYIKYSTYHAGAHFKKDIINTVIFSKNIAYPISDTTLLIGVEPQTSYQATELFKAYLGEKQFFDIFYLNGYLWILFNPETNPDSLKKLRQDIQTIIEEAIKIHTAKQKKVFKLIKDSSTSSITD